MRRPPAQPRPHPTSPTGNWELATGNSAPSAPSPTPHLPISPSPHLSPSGNWQLETGNYPSESASPAATPDAVLLNPLAALMTRHVLRDGEIIILMLRPSLWFIPFVTLRFAAVVLILMITAQIYNEQLHYHARLYHELGVLLLIARLMTAVLQWLGRLYILTDLRIIQMVGTFTVQIADCPLRKVGRVRVIYTVKERLLRLGSIEIIPFDEAFPIGLWQTVPKPKQVHHTILQAIRRAKQGMSP